MVIEAEEQSATMQCDGHELCDRAFSDDNADGEEGSEPAAINDEAEHDAIDYDHELTMNDVADEEAGQEKLRNRVHDYDAANISFNYDDGGDQQDVSRDPSLSRQTATNQYSKPCDKTCWTFNEFYNSELERLQLMGQYPHTLSRVPSTDKSIDALTTYDGYIVFRFCHFLANGKQCSCPASGDLILTVCPGVIREDLLNQLSRPSFSEHLAQRAKEVYWEEFAQHFFQI